MTQRENPISKSKTFCPTVYIPVQLLPDRCHLPHALQSIETDPHNSTHIYTHHYLSIVKVLISPSCMQVEMETCVLILPGRFYHRYIIHSFLTNHKVSWQICIHSPPTRVLFVEYDHSNGPFQRNHEHYQINARENEI